MLEMQFSHPDEPSFEFRSCRMVRSGQMKLKGLLRVQIAPSSSPRIAAASRIAVA